MIGQITAAWLSSLFGLLGSLALAVPFFADFLAKRRRVKRLTGLRDGTFSPDDAAALEKPVAKHELESVLAAGIPMAASAALGCVLLVLSFLTLVFQKHAS